MHALSLSLSISSEGARTSKKERKKKKKRRKIRSRMKQSFNISRRRSSQLDSWVSSGNLLFRSPWNLPSKPNS
jgi:hypothetical protein